MRQNGIILVAAGAICAGAAAADYAPGFVWDRSADWTNGKLEGYAWQNGNPDDDKNARAAWSYELVQTGGGLGDPKPWYAEPKSLLVWDADWFGGGYPVWAAGNNSNPNIAKTTIVHFIEGNYLGHAPLVRWINPTGATATVHITGNLKVSWSGQGNLGTPVQADVAIVQVSPKGQHTVLFSGTYDDPSPGDNNIGTKTVQVDLPGVVVPDGGSILIGVRGRSAVNGRWFAMDDNLKVTLDAVEGGGGCVPDIDGNGLLDLFDFLGFVNLFNAGC